MDLIFLCLPHITHDHCWTVHSTHRSSGGERKHCPEFVIFPCVSNTPCPTTHHPIIRYTQMRMYIGQRDAANAKAAGPGASTDASGPGGDSAASMKTARQCRSLKKPDEEKSAEAKPSASMTLAAGGNTSSCPKHDTETRAEKEARAEAVAALGLLFAQGSPGVPSGTSSLVMQQQQQQGQTPCCDDGSRGRLPGFNPGRTESR